MTATVQEVREAHTGMSEGESIVILGDGPAQQRRNGAGFHRLCQRQPGQRRHRVNVINEQAFRDALFPWFEPRTAPAKTSDLPELMATPVSRSASAGNWLRYLVWIDGSTVRTDSGGSMTCSVTTAGAGCFGFPLLGERLFIRSIDLGSAQWQRGWSGQLRRHRHQLHAGDRCAPALHCPGAEFRLHQSCRAVEDFHHQRLTATSALIARHALPVTSRGVISTTSPLK